LGNKNFLILYILPSELRFSHYYINSYSSGGIFEVQPDDFIDGELEASSEEIRRILQNITS